MAEVTHIVARGKNPRKIDFHIGGQIFPMELDPELQADFVATLGSLQTRTATVFRCDQGSMEMSLDDYKKETGDGVLSIKFVFGGMYGNGSFRYKEVMEQAKVPAPETV